MTDRPWDDEQPSSEDPRWREDSPGADPDDAWGDDRQRPQADPTVQIPRPEQTAVGPHEPVGAGPGDEFAARPAVPVTEWAATPDDLEHQGPPEDLAEDDVRPPWLVPTVAGVGALLLGLVLGWLLWSGADEPAEDSPELVAQVEELTAENVELRGQVEELTAQLEELEATGGEESARLDELTAENEELRSEVDTLTGEVDGLAADNEELTTENEALTDQVAGLEQENAQLRDRIEDILADIDAAVVSAPDLVGGTVGFAAGQAEENGWVLVQIPSATDEVAPGTVVAQTPSAGTPMLSGSAMVVSVAAAPDPAPEPGLETIFEVSGAGPSTTGAVELAGGTRHVLAYSFSGTGRHVVTVIDAEDNPVAQLVDVNGTTEGATALPLVGSYRLQVETEDDADWTLRVVALP